MATPVKTASGKYRLRVYYGTDSNGKKKYASFTSDTAAKCEKEYKKWLKAGGGKIEEEVPKGPTLDEALDDYIEGCRNNKRSPYSPTTIKTYESARMHSFGAFNNMYALDITLEDVQDFVDARADQGRAAKTIKNDMYLLKPALEKAGNLNIRWKSVELPDQEPEEYIIPTDEQIQVLLKETKESDPELYRAIVLGAFCGCRRGEICALTYGDVTRTTVNINKALAVNEMNKYQQKETKTRAGKRVINIDSSVYDALMLRQRMDGVIYTPDTSLIGLKPELVTNRFNRLRTRLGYEFCFHALRHYHASIMVALDVPKKYAAEQMGHASYQMIDRVYGQIIKAKEAQVSASINTHTAAVLNGAVYNW